MKSLLTPFVLAGLLILSSCGSDDNGNSNPPGTIVDDEGVTIELEWSTGGSAQQAIDDADLDLELLLDNNTVRISNGFSSFESIDFEGTFADGDYQVAVEYFGGDVAVNFTVFVRPNSSSDQTFSAPGNFGSGGPGSFPAFVTINKSGNTYLIN